MTQTIIWCESFDMRRVDLNAIVEKIERKLIVKALEASGNSRKKASDLLGLKRTTLVMKMKIFGLLESMPPPQQTITKDNAS